MKLEPVIIKSKQTDDEYHLYHHPSGLDVLVMRMEGFRTTEALFATNYGSINTCFKTVDTGDFITVPDGIAHYLEHKLFENEDCGVLELYAKTGASANAFTSFEVTAYTFSTSSDYKEPLRLLLDFVQKPYFTDENVEKERGIIAQEIKMGQDSPTKMLFYELLKSLFHNHPVKQEIAGSVESIQEITTKLLYDCYNTFYNLHNMVLSIAGNVDDETVLSICDEMLKPAENKELITKLPEEPDSVVRRRSDIKMQVGVPIFNMGFKCKPKKGIENQRQMMVVSMMMRMIFGPTTQWYKSAFEDGLINSTFGGEVFCSNQGYFVITITGESKDPDAVKDRILKEIERVKGTHLDEKMFKIFLKSNYGLEISRLNNVAECAESMCFSYLDGITCFDVLSIYADMTLEEVEGALSLLDPEYLAFCTVSSSGNTQSEVNSK